MHVTGPSKGQPFPLGLLGASPSAVALDEALCAVLGLPLAGTPLGAALERREAPGVPPCGLAARLCAGPARRFRLYGLHPAGRADAHLVPAPGACSRVACAACGWRAENNESCSPGSEELTMPVILPGQTDIYALTDARLSCGRTLETVVSALLGAGVKIIQYREKHMKSGEMLEECRLMRRLTREAGACFIVDDHVDLAILAEADGVHIGQEDFPCLRCASWWAPRCASACPPTARNRPGPPWPWAPTTSAWGPSSPPRPRRTWWPRWASITWTGWPPTSASPSWYHRRHQGTQHHGCGPSRGPLLRPGLRTGGRPRHRRQGAGRTRRHAAGDVGYDFLGGRGPPRVTVDARSFLRRNGHGPSGRHTVTPGARGGPPPLKLPPSPARFIPSFLSEEMWDDPYFFFQRHSLSSCRPMLCDRKKEATVM